MLPEGPRGRRSRTWPIDREEAFAPGLAHKRAVEVGEPEALHGPPARLDDLALRAIAEHLRGQVLAAAPDPLLDVVGMDLEGLASGISTAHQKVHVRVVGVVVVDGHPFQTGTQVALHLRDEGAGVRLEVELVAVLGRDNELPEPLIARPLPAAEGRGELDPLTFRAEASALPALALGALPGQVGAVRGPGGTPPILRVGGLHGAPLPARVHARQERSAAASPPPELTGAPPTAAHPAW